MADKLTFDFVDRAGNDVYEFKTQIRVPKSEQISAMEDTIRDQSQTIALQANTIAMLEARLEAHRANKRAKE